MNRFWILLADADAVRRAGLLETLRRRYGVDYEVVGAVTSDEALARCAALREQQRQLALVIALLDLRPLSGVEWLSRTREDHPDTRLLLLLPWGALADPRPLVDAVSHGGWTTSSCSRGCVGMRTCMSP